jgi:hypothetical protein
MTSGSGSSRPTPAPFEALALVQATIAALLVFLAIALAGCGIMKAKEDAEEALTLHFEAVAKHSTAAVLSRYDAKFFEAVPREEWAKRLALVETKLGDYQSFEIVNWNVNSKFGTDGGTYVSVTCKVRYSKHTAQEAFILFRTQDEQPFRIVRHGITSDAFLTE